VEDSSEHLTDHSTVPPLASGALSGGGFRPAPCLGGEKDAPWFTVPFRPGKSDSCLDPLHVSFENGRERQADPPARGEVPLENRFSALEGLPPNYMPPPILTGARGDRFMRVANELHAYYEPSARRTALPPLPPPFRHIAWGASDVKVSIYDYVESGCIDICVPWPKMSGFNPLLSRLAFWNRISLARLRFKGDKRTYVRVRGKDKDEPPVLTLHVPKRNEPFDMAHALAQASFQDEGEIFVKGLRVQRERLRELGVPDADVDKLYSGYELALTQWPGRFHGRNYGGAVEHPDKLSAEIARMLEAGYIEGPLAYVPHVVQGMGGVWKEDKQKWRTIMDATSAGVNPCSAHLGAQYDMLEHVLAGLRPSQLMSGLDLTDAFCNWPYTPTHSEFWGFRDQQSGDYYRYRFMAFGGCQSPSVQQHWARIIKGLINKFGLQHCEPRVAALPGFCCTGAYLDDFHLHHSIDASPEDARQQFRSVLLLLDSLGLVYKPSKSIWPTTECEYVGFVIDSVRRTVGITETRAASLRQEISDFLEQHPAGQQVSRRGLARLTGKLQWVARVVAGGQHMLRGSYDSLQDFEDPTVALRSVKSQWADKVLVRLSPRARAGMCAFEAALERLPGRPIFLENVEAANGFWEGFLPDSDDQLDADGVEGVSTEDVEVLTGDASGKMGGGWWRSKRYAFAFPPEEQAPARSSNFRELRTAVEMIRHWGPELRGRRVLLRTDNITTAASVNRLSTRHETLRPLVDELLELVQRFGIQLRARHIPGLRNWLADRLSRQIVLESREDGDWRFRRDEFLHCQSRTGREFDTDACADPLGLNSHCERFHSRLDSTLDHTWAGHHTWCNADWQSLPDVLPHFRQAYASAPLSTSAVFVVPARPTAAWWRLLRGGQVIAFYPKGSDLFSAPGLGLMSAGADGRVARESGGGLSVTLLERARALENRTSCGPTHWPVVVVSFAPALPPSDSLAAPSSALARGGRLGGVARGAQHRPGDVLGLRQPELSGDASTDAMLMRQLRPRVVRELRRADF